MNLRIEQTCGACPEQYDVFDEDNKQVGYIRLRYGYLRVDYPDCGGETIFEHEFEESLKGCFSDELEKHKYMGMIIKRIEKRIASE